MSTDKQVSKFTPGLIEYVKSLEESSKVDVFLIFQSPDNIESYIKTIQTQKTKFVKIIQRYTTIPALLIKCDKEQLTKFEAEKAIKVVDNNSRYYLSQISSQEMSIPEEKLRDSLFVSEKQTGKGIRIALVDSGIDNTHPRFRKRVISTIDITSEPWDDLAGHGTIMAGIMSEIAPQSNLINVKVCTRSGLLFSSDVLLGLDNLYKNSPHFDILVLGCASPTVTNGRDVITQICKEFLQKGVKIVAPAGNFGPEINTIGFPSQIPDVFCIGSLNSKEQISFFTSRNPEKTNYYVLGENIAAIGSFHGTVGKQHPSQGDKRIISGTSISAAKFAGILALIIQKFPEYSTLQIHHFLQDLHPDSRIVNLDEVRKRIFRIRPNIIPYKKVVIISSLITAILGILGIGSIFLFR